MIHQCYDYPMDKRNQEAHISEAAQETRVDREFKKYSESVAFELQKRLFLKAFGEVYDGLDGVKRFAENHQSTEITDNVTELEGAIARLVEDFSASTLSEAGEELKNLVIDMSDFEPEDLGEDIKDLLSLPWVEYLGYEEILTRRGEQTVDLFSLKGAADILEIIKIYIALDDSAEHLFNYSTNVEESRALQNQIRAVNQRNGNVPASPAQIAQLDSLHMSLFASVLYEDANEILRVSLANGEQPFDEKAVASLPAVPEWDVDYPEKIEEFISNPGTSPFPAGLAGKDLEAILDEDWNPENREKVQTYLDVYFLVSRNEDYLRAKLKAANEKPKSQPQKSARSRQ